MGYPNLGVFLGKEEEDLFKIIKNQFRKSNLNKEEWKTVRCLANDRSIVIEEADKDSSTVLWDRVDYMKEVEKQLSHSNVFREK